MTDTPSIVSVKRFTYRTQPEEFSNRYHFTGTTPATELAWETLANNIIGEERKTVTSKVTFVRAYGYVAGTDHSVAQNDYTVAPRTANQGILFAAGAIPASGDTA